MRRLLLLGEKGLLHLCMAIPEGYMDETGCSFRALPDKTLAHTKTRKKGKDLHHFGIFCKCCWLRSVKAAPNVLRETRKYAKVLQ